MLVGGLVSLAVLAPWPLRGMWRDYPVVAVEVVLAAVLLVVVGSLLVGHPRSSTSGWWLVVTAACLLFLGAGVGQGGAWPITAWFASSLIWLLLVLVASTFPRGHRWTREHRAFFVVAIPHLLVLTLVLALISEPEWSGYVPTSWWPTVAQLPTAYALSAVAVSILDLLLGLWYFRITVLRLRSMAEVDRSALVPALWGVAAPVVAGIPAAVVQNIVLTQAAWAWGLFAQVLGFVAMAGAIVVAAHRVSTTRTRIADVVRSFSTSDDLASVRRVLQEGLSDPTLTVAFWSATHRCFLDERGEPVELEDDDGYRLTLTSSSGEPIGLVTLDPRLRPHQGFAAAAVAAAGFVCENIQLQAALRARIEDVEASRAEIVEAQVAERRRVSDELHDRLEQSLLGLAARARALEARAVQGRPDRREAVEAMQQLTSAAHETLVLLRHVSRGLPPPRLQAEGLRAALEDVADHLHLIVDLDVDVDLPRLGAQEADGAIDTAYLWISEALTNVVKHARTERAWVSVREVSGELVIDVRDDGVGGVSGDDGAPRALRRRAEAVRGRVAVESPAGRGTLVSAVLPLDRSAERTS